MSQLSLSVRPGSMVHPPESTMWEYSCILLSIAFSCTAIFQHCKTHSMLSPQSRASTGAKSEDALQLDEVIESCDQCLQGTRKHLDALEDHVRDAIALLVDQLWCEEGFRCHEALRSHSNVPAIRQSVRLHQVSCLPCNLQTPVT